VQNEFFIAIKSLKRPEYLKRCLASLEANVDLGGIDFWLFQDGEVNPHSGKRYATAGEVGGNVELFLKSSLPSKHVLQQKHNVGSGLQARVELEKLVPEYPYVMLVCNDLIFNRYYTKTVKTLFRQFSDRGEFGMMQTSYYCENAQSQTLAQAKAAEAFVGIGFGYRSELGFWASRWGLIGKQCAEYFRMIEDLDYREMLYNPAPRYKNIRGRLNSKYGAMHVDHVLEVSVGRAGLKGLHTKALRHRIIGAKGMYSFRANLFKQAFSAVELHEVGDVDRYELVKKR